MATTALHPNALPGKPHNFSPKAEAGAGEHTGDFTRLSILGVPGGIRVFTAKAPAAGPEHTGDFTRLSVIAVPGGIHTFTAKTEAVPPSIVTPPPGGGKSYSGGWKPRYDRELELTLREDEEIVEIISILASRRLI